MLNEIMTRCLTRMESFPERKNNFCVHLALLYYEMDRVRVRYLFS